MFEGKFLEGEHQSTTLDEIDDVVSVQSFELIAQWLYLGRVNFGELKAEGAISAAVELLRLADMWSITGLEHDVVDWIKTILIENHHPSDQNKYSTHPDTNIYCLTSENILSAINLPRGHPLRTLFAEALVEGYLHQRNGDDHGDFKFIKEIQEVPELSIDLLKAVRNTLGILRKEYSSISAKDPFSGRSIHFKSQ
jgi:hypothetical protein